MLKLSITSIRKIRCFSLLYDIILKYIHETGLEIRCSIYISGRMEIVNYHELIFLPFILIMCVLSITLMTQSDNVHVLSLW